MSEARRPKEAYARFAVQLRTHDRPRVAEKACPGAMGLYAFLVMQARGERSDGDVSVEAALESWGAPTSYRKRQLAALQKAGLVAIRDDGRIQIVKYEEHNDVAAVIEANRLADNARKQKSRALKSGHGDVTRDIAPMSRVTDASVPSSSSTSRSLEPERDQEPYSAREPGSIPEGTASALEVIAAYEQAVSSVTNEPFWIDHRSPERAKLLRLVPVYCKASDIPGIRAWLHESVTAWVAPRVDAPEFASGFAPRGFEAWLQGGRKPPARPTASNATPPPISRARQYVSNEPSWKQQR